MPQPFPTGKGQRFLYQSVLLPHMCFPTEPAQTPHKNIARNIYFVKSEFDIFDIMWNIFKNKGSRSPKLCPRMKKTVREKAPPLICFHPTAGV